MPHDVGEEAADVAPQQVNPRVEEEGQDGHVCVEDGLGPDHEVLSALRVGLLAEAFERGRVLAAHVARVVVLPAGHEDVQKGEGVGVVRAPRSAGQLEVVGVELLEQAAPLHVLDLDLDSEVLFQVSLHVLRDHPVNLVGVVGQGDLREARSVGVAGLGQQAAGLLRVEGVALGGAEALALERPVHHVGRRPAPTFEDVGGQALLVHGLVEGAAHAHVAEWSAFQIEDEVVGAQVVGVDDEVSALVGEQTLDLGVGDLGGDLHLPGLVPLEGRGLALEVVEDHLRDLDGVGLAVVQVLHEHDAITELVLGHAIRPVDHDVLGAGPALLEDLDDVPGGRRVVDLRDQRREEGRWVDQAHLQRAPV